MFKRHRRIRNNSILRDMVAQHHISTHDLVMPVFVKEGISTPLPIDSMPGQFQHNIDSLSALIECGLKNGIRSYLLFGIPKSKSPNGHAAHLQNGLIPQVIQSLKQRFDGINLIADVCLCEYTSHGHCGILEGDQINNDETLPHLAQTSMIYAQAGADVIAPSDMMDGRVLTIRQALDKSGYSETPICAYSVKYASALYAPFRDAAENAPQGPSRESYQMDFRNDWEAVCEAQADIDEGADMILVKPAMPYLDIIASVTRSVNAPVGVYQVSGEYSMVKAAVAKGWIDEKRVVYETLIAAKRAGASFIVTYWAMEFANWQS